LKVAYHIILHLLGLGCVAACIAIVATMGALDIHWVGWVAVAFLGQLAIGIVVGWFPWRGKPLRVMIKGFYVMSAVALIGFGFSMEDPMRPQLWMVLAPLGAAILVRAAVRFATLGRNRDASATSVTLEAPTPRRAPADDPFFN
jgi:peptidoglycan/LPS O-acetylase OafA/YrhL